MGRVYLVGTGLERMAQSLLYWPSGVDLQLLTSKHASGRQALWQSHQHSWSTGPNIINTCTHTGKGWGTSYFNGEACHLIFSAHDFRQLCSLLIATVSQ